MTTLWTRRGAGREQSDERQLSSAAPALGDYTDKVLFGNVWKRPQPSPRDRSLVTVSSLVAQYRINELPKRVAVSFEICAAERRHARGIN
jgi:alkylhydroperoxidase/carboxymuconolactone decarboxylase family protein YurZ